MRLINILMACVFIFLASCGETGKILRNEKVRTTDEFLVKQKDPLILPPDYDKIPEPGSLSKAKDNKKSVFKEILKKQKKTNVKNKQPSSTESSVLKRITK
tara:strand:+ start:23 stop:325 length:303 start_codon:yes stop_codon:yes gene_type:complete